MTRIDQPTRITVDWGRSARPSTLPVLAPILLLLLAYMVAVYASPETATAWPRLLLLAIGIAVAVLTAFGGRVGGTRLLGWLCVACVFLAAGIAAYFALSYNWTASATGKFAPIQEAGRMIQLYRPPLAFPDDINANVAGGALAVLLPLGFAGLLWAAGRDRPHPLPYLLAFFVGVVLLLLLIVGVLGLILTASRGAWLGTVAGVIVGALVSVRAKHIAWPVWVDAVLLVLAFAGLVAAFWSAVFVPGADRYLGSVASAGGSAIGRAQLWREMLSLAGDYPFTGVGFGATMMAHASYSLLTHVGYITHAHNLFLQIAVEAGLPALVAFLALAGVALWSVLRSPANLFVRMRRGPARDAQRIVRTRLPFRIGAAAALTALAVHGMVDAGLYASRLAPLVFLPIGVGLALRTDSRIMRLAANVMAARERGEKSEPVTLPAAADQRFECEKESVGPVMVAQARVESGSDPIDDGDEYESSNEAEWVDAIEWESEAEVEPTPDSEQAQVPEDEVTEGIEAPLAGQDGSESEDPNLAPVSDPQPEDGADVVDPAVLPPADADDEPRGSFPFGAASIVVIAALFLSLFLLRPVRAAFQANLGAIAQSWVELSSYRWPDWPIQDALRTSPEVDLSAATDRYMAALALDAGNVTANRRLGQIELSRGDYSAALVHLQVAEDRAPWQRATRQLLGEAYAVSGDTVRAAELWRTIDLSQGQIDARKYWYESIGREDLVARIAEAAR